MGEAQDIVDRARAQANTRARAHRPRTDYAALNKLIKRQRAALTRAKNSGDSAKVVLACRDAVREWDAPGVMWPDDWAHWQRTLDDVLGYGNSVDLRDLD